MLRFKTWCPPASRKRLQDSAIARKRETKRLLDQAKARGLNTREKSDAQRIEDAFVQQSDAAEKRNDMRQADALADKALILARELQSAKCNEFDEAAANRRRGSRGT